MFGTSKNILVKRKPERITNMHLRLPALLVTICLMLGTPLLGQVQPSQFGTVELRGDSLVTPGAPFEVSIYLTDSTAIVGGFNLLIEFDYGALVFDSATLGQHTKGQWEYFTVRSALSKSEDEKSTAAFIRLLAIADSQDPDNKHPDSISLVGPGEIAKLFLYATDRSDFSGKTTNLRFLWEKCADNTFSDKSGNRLLLAASVIGTDQKLITTERYSGPTESCFRSGYNPPSRSFRFANLAFRIR